MRPICTTLIVFVVFIFSCNDKLVIPASPDGSITVSPGTDGAQAFSYAIFKNGKELIGQSAIMMKFQNQADPGTSS